MKHISKADALTITLLLIIGLVVSFIIYMPTQENGAFVEIRIDGNVTQRYSLAENRRETIQTASGSNTFYIKDGNVFMEHADCHDQICVNRKGISRQGQTIVCLPHKLVLAIVSEDATSPAYDAVTGGAS